MILRILIVLALAAGIFGGAYYAVHRLYVEPEQRLATDKKLPPPTPPPDPALDEFARCEQIRRTSTPAEARNAFERFLKMFPSSKQRSAALDVIGEINSAEFFSAKATEETTYIVARGDALSRVAARKKIPIELLVHLNKLTKEVLQPNQRLFTPPVEFHLLLQQKTRTVVLMNGSTFFRQYAARSWPGMNKKPFVLLPKQSGRVLEKLAMSDKGPVKPTDLAFSSASHVINVSIAGHGLFAQPDDPKEQVHRSGGAQIGLAPEHLSEIALLLAKGAPVTLE